MTGGSVTGPTGARGARGAAGPAGPSSLTGPTGVTGYSRSIFKPPESDPHVAGLVWNDGGTLTISAG
jgi:hypothetical protein